MSIASTRLNIRSLKFLIIAVALVSATSLTPRIELARKPTPARFS